MPRRLWVNSICLFFTNLSINTFFSFFSGNLCQYRILKEVPDAIESEGLKLRSKSYAIDTCTPETCLNGKFAIRRFIYCEFKLIKSHFEIRWNMFEN